MFDLLGTARFTNTDKFKFNSPNKYAEVPELTVSINLSDVVFAESECSMVVIQDLTAHVRLEQAQKHNKQMQQEVAVISHELKNFI